MNDSVNPRRLRDQFQTWRGKRVNVGTTTNHYLCGTWTALDPLAAKFDIGGHEMIVRVADITTISEAPPLQADFFK